MNCKVIDIPKVVKELENVLVQNNVTIGALDNIIDELKKSVYIHTVVQSSNLK